MIPMFKARYFLCGFLWFPAHQSAFLSSLAVPTVPASADWFSDHGSLVPNISFPQKHELISAFEMRLSIYGLMSTPDFAKPWFIKFIN